MKSTAFVLLKKFLLEMIIVSLNENETLSDIDNSWAYDDIKNLINADIINGYADVTFRPNNNITRAEFVVAINNATHRLDKVIYSKDFRDVSKDFWVYDDIQVA